MACPPTFEIETAESHPDSALITGEWLLPEVALTLSGALPQPQTHSDTHLPHPLPNFHVWVPEGYAFVLGASQTLEREMNVEVWHERHTSPAAEIPVRLCKRRGGGGAVLLGPHSLCLAMRSPRIAGRGPLEYFGHFNGLLAEGIQKVTDITLTPMGISDLAYGDRKVVGSSLYLSRDWALYLASVLITQPAEFFDVLLKHPSREPDYRQGRNHRDFITDLATLQARTPITQAPITHPSKWVTDLTHHLGQMMGQLFPT